MKIFRYIFLSYSIVFSSYFTAQKKITVSYLDNSKIKNQTIKYSLGVDGKIKSKNISSVKFSILDSISYTDNNPDRSVIHSKEIALVFTKPIKKYSPEYYSIYTVREIDKAIEYYNRLFDKKIDFDSQKDYKNIEITFGDVPLFTTPRAYIFEQKSHPSPSLFYHEIGHRAFWLIEKDLGVKFKGLSYIHMGLLEYFTVSLNDSPVVGEDALPKKLIRNASWKYGYPAHDSLKIKSLFPLLKESYPEKIKDPTSNLSNYIKIAEPEYSTISEIVDNHRGGMIITSTLWRIREQLGKSKTDELVAAAILDLNNSFDNRDKFYKSDLTKLAKRIDWCDLYFSLIQKDKELNKGKGKDVISKEFQETGYPIEFIDLK